MAGERKTWLERLDRLRADLADAKFRNTLDVNDFDKFNGQLEHLYTRYSKSGLNKCIKQFIEPHFAHLRSFERAIASATQPVDAASYVWAASLAIIEV
jgi:phytoene/squalene synthetase